MINELWCHRIDRIYFEVHPKARIYIPFGTIGESIMGGANGSLENYISTAAFNSLEFLEFGEVDFCIFSILGMQRPPKSGAELVSPITQVGEELVTLIPLVAGVEVLLIIVPLILLEAGVEVPQILL